MKIKELPKSLRPREKAMLYGINSLSNAELLAIFIETGIRDLSALDIASSLLIKYGSLSKILTLDLEELITNKGISKIKALKIISISRVNQLANYYSPITSEKITNASDVFKHFKNIKDVNKNENVYIMLLDNKNFLINEIHQSIGKEDSVVFDVNSICFEAIKVHAKRIILVHNHPKGDSSPSSKDRVSTSILLKALSNINITLIDHIIIGNNEFYSLANDKKIITNC